jgi:hypothetical protein
MRYVIFEQTARGFGVGTRGVGRRRARLHNTMLQYLGCCACNCCAQLLLHLHLHLYLSLYLHLYLLLPLPL